MIKILGLACSLRNARWGAGNEVLVRSLRACETEEQLHIYLREQSSLHLQNFIDSGREEGKNFQEIYRNLKHLSGDRGLSNSEVCLAAALWSAMREGCEIKHLSLSEFFPATGKVCKLDELKTALCESDGIIVSSPVYFGDRGSLAQQLVDVINDDQEFKKSLRDKVYVGIAVGAKRNGGQETTLIYQLCDMINIGFLGVGNDSDTTAQYGGTAHAGDVGTAGKDEYGLWTSMGAGRRIARVAQEVLLGRQRALSGNPRINFWILQDRNGIARSYAEQLISSIVQPVDIKLIDLSSCCVARCLACDICPTSVDRDEVYRCIIKGGARDRYEEIHSELLYADAIIPLIYSPRDSRGLHSKYQQCIERTRYLRRGDYIFADVLIAPLVLEEVGAMHNMHMRAMTSMIRHHTVLSEPMVAYMHEGVILNSEQILSTFCRFVHRAGILASGRLQTYMNNNDKYEPVGYILSAEKDKEDQELRLRDAMIAERRRRLAADAKERL